MQALRSSDVGRLQSLKLATPIANKCTLQAFLLALSRPDLRDFDRARMQPGHPLYCFVFDTSCIRWGRRSVRDLVTTARILRVRIVRAEDPPRRWAIIQLFDQTVVDEQQLDSQEYFCRRWNTDAMTWSLEHDGRAWRSAYPIFDQYTDVHCRGRVGRPQAGLTNPGYAGHCRPHSLHHPIHDRAIAVSRRSRSPQAGRRTCRRRVCLLLLRERASHPSRTVLANVVCPTPRAAARERSSCRSSL
jgi:hypothetical protein